LSNNAQSANDPSFAGIPVDGPEPPRRDQQPKPEDKEPASAGNDNLPGASFLDPPLVPQAKVDPSPVARGRRRIDGIAPAAVLLPLAFVSLAILLLKPGWLQPVESSVQTQPTEVALATSPPSPADVRAEITASLPASVSAAGGDDLLAEAEALLWQSKFEQAIAIYRELARQSADDARPEIGWAAALLLDGLPDQSLRHAQQALALDPGNVEAATALARAYVGAGDRTKALSAAQTAVALDARHAPSRAVLAEAHLLHGHLDLAMEHINLALIQDRANAEAHRVRAELYEAVDNDLAGAIGELRLAAELQPQLWVRPYDLGLALLKAGDHDAAIVALTEAWVLRRSLLTYGALGQAYYRLGQYDQAASYLEQSLSAGAWNADTYALLADINARQGRCGNAMTYAKEALTVDPNSPLALQATAACQQSGPVHSPTPTAPSTTQDQPEVLPPPPALGGQIAFPIWNVEMGYYDTYIANVDGSERKLVIEGMHQPAFSPDGQWLAVNGERQDHLNLFIVRSDGSDLQEVTDHVEDGLPSWSQAPLQSDSGELSLAFSSTRHGDKQPRIFVLDRVPFNGQEVQARALNSGSDDVRGEYPAWTMAADQAHIVYSGCHYDGLSAQCGLLSMPAEPGPQTPQPLTDHPQDTAPAGYGSKIAFMSNRDGNWEIYLVNSDGSGLKRLTHNASNDGLPAWSPDGKTIAFVSDEGGTWALWTVSLEGANRRKLFDLGGSGLASDWQQERISWGPDSG